MIRAREALMAFKVLERAYPKHPVHQETVALYVQTWSQPPFDDEGVLYEMVNAHVREHDWFPSVHQTIDGYQAAARARTAIRQSEERAAAEARGVLPGMPGPDVGYGAEMVDVIRTALAEVFRGKRVHRHQRGVPAAETCPTCSQVDAIAASVAERADALRRARGVSPASGAVVTWACPRCHDAEWVPVGGSDQWRPCPQCNRTVTLRWEDGHYRPGHTCSECEGVRRGKNPPEAA